METETVEGQAFCVINIHQATSSDRKRQDIILEGVSEALLSRESIPTILGGDLNASPPGGRFGYATGNAKHISKVDEAVRNFLARTGGKRNMLCTPTTWRSADCSHAAVAAASPESKEWTFLTLEGEQSIQTFSKKTCRELYRRTTLTEDQAQEMTDESPDEVLEDTMWEEARPWEEQWETLKVNENKVEEQELDDEDRHSRFWRHRPDGFTVNEKEHRVIYILELKRVSDTGEKYVPTPRN